MIPPDIGKGLSRSLSGLALAVTGPSNRPASAGAAVGEGRACLPKALRPEILLTERGMTIIIPKA